MHSVLKGSGQSFALYLYKIKTRREDINERWPKPMLGELGPAKTSSIIALLYDPHVNNTVAL